MLVSVIIPAYNAQRYLGAALSSARAQTYSALEIIVVNDGSTDATAEIAESVARVDKRVRVVGQMHAGVAAARNRGLAEARGDFVAPLDADDLWHPQNVASQMRAVTDAGRETAVSYAWYVSIDEYDRVVGIGAPSVYRTKRRVLFAQINSNFVGNASSTLMRRSLVEAVGGYDESLRARGAEGCEDHALYLALAERWNFTVVPRYLVAYRRHAESMSQDYVRMARSQTLVVGDLRRRRADISGYRFSRGLASIHEVVLMAALRRREWSKVRSVLHSAAHAGAGCLLDLFCIRLSTRFARYALRRLRGSTHQKGFDNPSIGTFWGIDGTNLGLVRKGFGKCSASFGSESI